MSSLVGPLASTPIQKVFSELDAARQTLLTALNQHRFGSAVSACALKRIAVTITPSGLVSQSSHNYSEVVNQLATLERLVDALGWMIMNPKFSQSLVELCNPTSSSMVWPLAGISNDLIVSDPQGGVHLFEVSDTEGNNNRKMKTDIERLFANKGLMLDRVVHMYVVCSESSKEFVTRTYTLAGPSIGPLGTDDTFICQLA